MRHTDLINLMAEIETEYGVAVRITNEIPSDLLGGYQQNYYGRPTLFVRASEPNWRQCYIMLHELGHHVCAVKGCECASLPMSDPLAEAHAEAFALQHPAYKKYMPDWYVWWRTHNKSA